MRIPLWPGLRLSVWERQNPDAVKVTMARSKPYQPIRRVLSMRGWMLLWVRYDWRDYSPPAPVVTQRVLAFREAADTLRQIDPEGFRQAADVCEVLSLRAERDLTGVDL
jgi:hypothetical protein